MADAWGYLTYAGALFMTDSPSASTPTSVFSGSTATGARSDSSMITWVEWASPKAVIRRWTPAGGSQVLLQRPQHVGKFSITDTLVVWLELTGDNPLEAPPSAANLFWAPTSDLGNAQGGVSLPTDVQISRMAASDSWAAVEHCTKDQIPACSVLAFRLADGKGWTIAPPTGRTFSILGIREKRLLVCAFRGVCSCKQVEISAEHEGYATQTIVLDLPQEECGDPPHKEVAVELEPQP